MICSNDALAGTLAGKLVLWDVETGEIIYNLVGHTYYPRACAFSPDGRTALTGSMQWGPAWEEEGVGGELILWDLTTGQEIRRFEPTTSVLDVQFSPDGRSVIAGNSIYSGFTLWDVATGQPIRQFAQYALPVSFAPDPRYVLGGTDLGSVVLVNTETSVIVRQYMGPTATFWAFDLSPDGKYLLGGGQDSLFVLWNFQTGEEIQRFWGHGTSTVIWNIAFSPDGQTVYTSAFAPQGEVIQWRINEWSLDELLAWVQENRYVREFTCDERAQYRIEPLCEGESQ